MNNFVEQEETFLDHKTKKKWKDPSTGHICFMLYPRSLYVTWAGSAYWNWKCFKETSHENIEVVKLETVCWLDVRGKLEVSELTAGVEYEAVYEVKLTKGASGWELPITSRLTLPNGTRRDRKLSLLEKPKGEWIEIRVGRFKVEEGETKEVCFDIEEHGGHWKTGLIIRGAFLRPVK